MTRRQREILRVLEAGGFLDPQSYNKSRALFQGDVFHSYVSGGLLTAMQQAGLLDSNLRPVKEVPSGG